jgi:hypothetical protein
LTVGCRSKSLGQDFETPSFCYRGKSNRITVELAPIGRPVDRHHNDPPPGIEGIVDVFSCAYEVVGIGQGAVHDQYEIGRGSIIPATLQARVSLIWIITRLRPEPCNYQAPV